MKQLVLLRHAEASWELAGELDHQRGLTETGIAECLLVAELVREQAVEPQLVLCSTAQRTRETLEHIAAALPPAAAIEYRDELYNAKPAALFDAAIGTPPEIGSLLIVGHNPSIHDFAVELATADEPIAELAGNFPNAALAQFEFDCEWQELAPGCARLTGFSRPEDVRSLN